jgi:hypothetical protein
MSTIGPDGEIENEFQHDGNDHDRAEYYRTHKEYAEAQRQRNKIWAKENHAKKAGYWRKYKYSLSNEDYQQLLDLQQGRCAICRKTPKEVNERSLSVDHNHTTNKVRGLLCRRCNLAVAYAEYEHAKQVQKYIEEN